MKKQESLIEKIFGAGFSVGNSRVPLRSNVYNGQGYTQIGGTTSKIFDMDRRSPLLGNATASNRLSSYYEKMSELKGYQLLDISKLATNFFADYVINFLTDDSNGQQVVSILNDQGNNDEQVTERINDILTKEIKIFDYIKNHVLDYIYYGGYYSMLQTSKDELGHLQFSIQELHDPLSVVKKRKRNQDTKEITEVFLAKGDDGVIYEIPKNEVIYIALNNLRLVNDLSDAWKSKQEIEKRTPKLGKDSENNREHVLRKESYIASEPLFYSLILKVKELVIKELLVSLISLRDISSVQLFLLQFDKSVPLESANELCARASKLANNTNELGSFLTAQFDVVSFIENTLTQPAKFIPDYNSTIGGKSSMIPLDKLTDKLLDIMQTIDQCKNNVLSPLGLPSTLIDSTSGSKWQVLQQSERANSKVSSFMSGIKDSVVSLVCNIYEILYSKELDPSLVKLHICEKTSVEYNNQINQSESIGTLVNSIVNILQTALQTVDIASPLLDTQAFLTYIHNLLKDIDPNTETLINEDTMKMYMQLVQAKLGSTFEQLGVEMPETLKQK